MTNLLSGSGIAKLIEECGEVTQIAGKLLTYPDGVHPDGKGDLYVRLEEEIADVLAAASAVMERLSLDRAKIEARREAKLRLFREWALEDRV